MINKNTIIVFDFETGSVDPNTCEVIQLAAQAYNPRTLELIPNAQFSSMIKPENFKNLTKEALEINKKTVEELKDAPSLDVVWKQFVNFIGNYNQTGKIYDAPIGAGHNIKGFDMIIIERLCKQFGNTDKKDSKQNLFNRRTQLDLLDFCFLWFENCKEPTAFNMGVLRTFFGLSSEQAHDALFDVQQTGAILMRLLGLHRRLGKTVAFKDSMKEKDANNSIVAT